MGEAKRRKEKNPDYGAIAFQDSVINLLDEHLALRGDRIFSVAILKAIPTTEKIANAAAIFADWIIGQDINGMLVFGVGEEPDDALSVGIAFEKQVKNIHGINISSLLAALVTSAKSFIHTID